MSTDFKYRRKAGDMYGHLELLYSLPSNGKHLPWMVRCHGCGKEYIKKSVSLKRYAQSCGCKMKRRDQDSPNWGGVGEISGSFIGHYKTNAKRRGIEFLITPEFMWRLFLLQDRKCALSGLPIKFGRKGKDNGSTASLDRIDSSKPYQIGNVQWLHKHVNMMKLDHDQKYFIKLCKLISK